LFRTVLIILKELHVLPVSRIIIALINIVMCLVFNIGHFLVIRKLPMGKN